MSDKTRGQFDRGQDEEEEPMFEVDSKSKVKFKSGAYSDIQGEVKGLVPEPVTMGNMQNLLTVVLYVFGLAGWSSVDLSVCNDFQPCYEQVPALLVVLVLALAKDFRDGMLLRLFGEAWSQPQKPGNNMSASASMKMPATKIDFTPAKPMVEMLIDNLIKYSKKAVAVIFNFVKFCIHWVFDVYFAFIEGVIKFIVSMIKARFESMKEFVASLILSGEEWVISWIDRVTSNWKKWAFVALDHAADLTSISLALSKITFRVSIMMGLDAFKNFAQTSAYQVFLYATGFVAAMFYQAIQFAKRMIFFALVVIIRFAKTAVLEAEAYEKKTSEPNPRGDWLRKLIATTTCQGNVDFQKLFDLLDGKSTESDLSDEPVKKPIVSMKGPDAKASQLGKETPPSATPTPLEKESVAY